MRLKRYARLRTVRRAHGQTDIGGYMKSQESYDALHS